MLTMTPTAASALSKARSDTGVPGTYGVRFFATSPTPSQAARLAFEFVESAQPDDTVTNESGLQAFVAPEVDELIGDATVDVETSGGQSELVVRRNARNGGA